MQSRYSAAAGFLIQTLFVALLLLLIQPPQFRQTKARIEKIIFFHPLKLFTSNNQTPKPGGGGQRAKTPVAHGTAPRFERKPFLMPVKAMTQPKLAIIPAIAAQAPQVEATNYGDPMSKLFDNSPGQGTHGFGNSDGGGIGNRPGDGDSDEGTGGTGAYPIGPGISSPRLISKVEPEYSDDARKAKYSGIVHLSVIVDERGIPQNIRVTIPLGLGLDEKAVQAVALWRFQPGTRNGRPVKVRASIEVSFRLL